MGNNMLKTDISRRGAEAQRFFWEGIFVLVKMSCNQESKNWTQIFTDEH